MDITNDAITYNNQSIPTRNVASASMVERRVLRPISDEKHKARRKRFLGIAFVLLCVSLIYPKSQYMFPGYIYYSLRPFLPEFVIFNIAYILMALAAFFAIRGVMRPNKYVWEFGVSLQTNAGAVSLLWSRDREFIQKLRDVIFKAISSSNSGVQYTVNVDNREINDNSQNTFNTTNNYDFSVNFTHHHGLDANDLQFLSNGFNEAMNELGAKLDRAGAEGVVAELNLLRAELKKSEPDKSALRKTYDKLKAACDATETASTAAGLLSTIWAGVSIFL